MTNLIESIKRHEGFRLKPYRCTAGKLTIGWGRNIEDNGITLQEAEFLLHNDITSAEATANQFVWYRSLSDNRREVIIEMIFQMGLPTFLKFKKTIQALRDSDFEEAADQMLDSNWHKQTPNRAETLAAKMRAG